MNSETFFMQGIMPLVVKSPVWHLHQLLDWQAIERKLVGLYQREISRAGGPIPYSPLSMFKLMLLGQWHNLSDPQLEHTLKVRVDFMAFTGFEPDEQGFPDATTICRFRNRLVKAQLDTVLLHLINSQLQSQGLKVKHSQGAILDATLITSAARPKPWLEANDTVETEPQTTSSNDSSSNTSDQPSTQPSPYLTLKQSADPDATWVKKGKRSYFGYRGYAIVEADDGYVEHVMMRPANESETHHLEQTVKGSPNKPKELLADKGFASKANRDWLKALGIGDLIQHKKLKGQVQLPIYKQLNTVIAKVRYKVERCFGTMKRQFALGRARYMTTAKVQAQMCWAALGANLLKAHNKLKKAQDNHRTRGMGASKAAAMG